MKNRKGILFVFLPLVITITLYLVFYSRIASTPSDADFWFIFVLGMSVGIALTRSFQWISTNRNE
ncbi:MAG: hypothetical protein NTU73_11475 [Ignavibacteriae bacterium]|nr:hypothetical protein [Ignavibacteriota bacterium]